VEQELVGTEVLGKNLAQSHFVHQKSRIISQGIEPEAPHLEDGD
jgi:hypothetical protein